MQLLTVFYRTSLNKGHEMTTVQSDLENIRSYLSIQPMLSCTGDEKSIRQLLSILLDNALKYSPAGGRLELRLEKQGRGILLTVSNTTGRPVDPDKLPRLFDRFYRSDQSRSSQTGGYGLGLSIAKSIVQAHKGKIRAESHDGMSLSVVVTLPN